MGEHDGYFSRLERLYDYNESTSLYMNTKTRTLCVVKRIAPGKAEELKKIKDLKDPALARVILVDDDPEDPRVVREYVDGMSLDSLLEVQPVLSRENADEIITALCGGLSAMHKAGLVHRDVNPKNIIIGENHVVKLIDYGIVRSVRPGATRDTTILGTVGYAAPEQFGFSQSDARTDVYSLGVLYNVMLTGCTPDERTADGEAGRIVRRCVAIDPADRYPSVETLREAIASSGSGKFGKLTSGLPGPRSGNFFVAVLSAILYLLAAGLIVTSYVITADPFLNTPTVIFTFVLPYVLLFDPFGVTARLPLLKTLPYKKRRVAAAFFSIFLFAVGFLIFILVGVKTPPAA